MLHVNKLPNYIWAEAMSIACHIHNRLVVRSGTKETRYKLWKRRKSNVKYFHVFGSKCYILEDREQRIKMDPKSGEGIFLGYTINSITYRVYNKFLKVMMESINMVIDDTPRDKEKE